MPTRNQNLFKGTSDVQIHVVNETFSSSPNEGWKSSPEEWNREPIIRKKSKGKKLICVLRVDIDGQRSEDLKLYQGEDRYTVVKTFVEKFDLADEAMDTLLWQLND